MYIFAVAIIVFCVIILLGDFMKTNKSCYGCFQITINDVLKNKNVSKNKLAHKASLQRTQLNSYCNNKIKRPDFDVLARICFALDCDLSEIIKYQKPSQKENTEG